MRNQHEILMECRAALEKSTGKTLEASEVESIVSKMDSESEEFTRRFGAASVSEVFSQPSPEVENATA